MQKYEFTLGVLVPVTVDDDGYVLEVGDLGITNSGLFSDAEDGAWSEAEQRWVQPPTFASARAQLEVERLIERHGHDELVERFDDWTAQRAGVIGGDAGPWERNTEDGLVLLAECVRVLRGGDVS